MRIKNFTSEDALEKIQELLDMDIPEYANDDEYKKICDVVELDYYDTCDEVIDEEYLKSRAKQLIDDDWLNAARNLLADIDLSASFWILDGNGWARDVDAADCQYLKDEIIRDLVDMLDDEDMEKYNDMMEGVANSD